MNLPIGLEFCKKLGTPVSQSTKGELILSIRNESFGKNDPRTRGPNTNNKLGFHTDRCDVIAFLCLMPAMSGENQVIDSRKIAEIIKSERPDLYEVLQQRFPYKRHVIDQGNLKPFVMQPVFSTCQGYFACSYLRVLIDRADHDDRCPSLSHSQRLAIDFLDEVCERPEIQEKFTMKRGEILLLNNWIKLHRRTAFEDFPEPEKGVTYCAFGYRCATVVPFLMHLRKIMAQPKQVRFGWYKTNYLNFIN